MKSRTETQRLLQLYSKESIEIEKESKEALS